MEFPVSGAGHETGVRERLERAEAPGTEHRALAFVHQWCFPIEQPPAESAPLRRLVGDPVGLRPADGRELTDFDEIAPWHDATADVMDRSTSPGRASVPRGER
ncbi:hypothetical protein GQF42_10445 [Streptomyces broussonetiae]|uniref:Uncharacterized protein n=1 Tax=Streptomyces broussonetiae TaxID=2686304 RepID=A0A6I6N0X6_9ACTN|nr:hypothetical protein [Streptomyces broussonetiae]QHA03630.1 hypothetical protein GQF42_10445 [Streptomyces broussonetiae]